MPQEKILIKFEAVDSEKLIKAIKTLDVQSKKLTGSMNGVAGSIKQTGTRSKAAAKSAGILDVSHHRLSATNGLLAKSFATLRSKMLLVSFGAMLIEKGITSLVKQYGAQEAANERLRAGLANVADTSEGVTQRLIDYSSALQQTTAFGDEFITSGMVQLTTFNLNEKAIKALTPQVLNVARAIQTVNGQMPDLNSLFIAFGKATSTGIGTLTRYGVVLTENERATLEAMDANEAAVEIANILKKQYGGLADAYKKTTAGQLEMAANARGDAAEALGEILAPAALKVSNALKLIFEAVADLPKKMKSLETSLYAAATAGGVAATAFGGFATALGHVKKAAVTLFAVLRANPIVAIASAVGAATFGLLEYFDVFKDGNSDIEDSNKHFKDFNKNLKDQIEFAKQQQEIEKVIQGLVDKTVEGQIASTLALIQKIQANKNLFDSERDYMNVMKDLIATFQKLNPAHQEHLSAIEEEKKRLKALEKDKEDFVKNTLKRIAADEKSNQKFLDGIMTQEKYVKMIRESQNEENTLFQIKKDIVLTNQQLAVELGLLTQTEVNRMNKTKEQIELERQQMEQQIKAIELDKERQEALDNIPYKATIVDMNSYLEMKKQILEAEKKDQEFWDKRLERKVFRKDPKMQGADLNFKEIEASLNKELGLTEESEDKKLKLIAIANQKRIAFAKDRLTEINLLDIDQLDKQKKIKDLQLETEEMFAADVLAIHKKLKEDQADVDRDAADEQKARRNEVLSDTFQAFQKTTSMFGDLAHKRMEADVKAVKESSDYQIAQANNDYDTMEKLEKDAKNAHHDSLVAAFRMEQGANLVQIGMDTASAVVKAYKLSPATFGMPWSGVLAGLGLAQAAMVASQPAPQKFQYGGMVGGNRHSQGGTMIEAEQGEFVMNRDAVEGIGIENLNRMNQGGGGGAIHVSVQGNVLTSDFVENELADSIKDAIRRGTDFGIN